MTRKIFLNACVYCLFLISACMYFLGIWWGLPSNQTKKFYGFDVAVSKEYLKKSWEISKSFSSEKLPRSVFNPIRSFHPDEHNILKSISSMNPEKFDFNPHFFEYPTGQIYLIALFLKVSSELNIVHLQPDIEYYFDHPDEMAKIYIAGRLLTASMALAGLIIFYRLILMIYSNMFSALLATMCLAFTPVYSINAHYMTVDVPMVFWIIVSMYFAFLYIQQRKLFFLFLSALCTGIAAGTKYPAGIFVFLFPLILFYTNTGSVRRFFNLTLVCCIIFFSAFFLTTPYSILSFGEFKRDLFYQAAARGLGSLNLFSYIRFLPDTLSALRTGCLWIVLLYIAGLIVAIKKRQISEKFLLSGFLLSIIPIFACGGFKYTRYYLIMLPFLAAITGKLFEEIFRLKSGALRLLLIFGCITAVLSGLIKSTAYTRLMTENRDVRIIAAECIEKDIPYGTTIIYTKDPWVFEVPPVSPLKYNLLVIPEHALANAPSKSFLIIGELQYFLTSGNRKYLMQRKIRMIEQKGFKLKEIFIRYPCAGPFSFDQYWTIHDMLYTHPAILLFYKP